MFRSIIDQQADRPTLLQPVFTHFDNEGSTDEVRFTTRKVVTLSTR